MEPKPTLNMITAKSSLSPSTQTNSLTNTEHTPTQYPRSKTGLYEGARFTSFSPTKHRSRDPLHTCQQSFSNPPPSLKASILSTDNLT